MIKRATLLMSIFFLLLLFATSVKAAKVKLPIKEIAGDQEVPGLTCGDGSNEDINKCCKLKDIDTNVKISDPGFFCLPLGGPCASELPGKAFEGFINSSSFPKQMQDLTKLTKKGEGCLVGTPDHPGAANCKCKANALSSLCARYLGTSSELAACNKCVTNGDAVWTGLGCIKITASGFVSSLMSIGLGIAGGISFLCILYAAFLMQTSSGNPERLKKAREYLTNCITGLLLIIFSVFILRIIGVDILGIPFLK